MSTQLNAATRLRAASVTAAPVGEDTHHTYMASLYTQMLKVLRREFPKAEELKKDFKLVKVNSGQRSIQLNVPALAAHKVDLPKHLAELGWVKSKKVSKGVMTFFRKDGTWPLLLKDGPESTQFLSLAPVDHVKEL